MKLRMPLSQTAAYAACHLIFNLGEFMYDPYGVMQFARATAKANGKALIISEDNTSGGWISIADAVSSGDAFAVEVKRGLIALDLDTADLTKLGEEAEKFAQDSGCKTLTVESGREGHRHLYIRPQHKADAAFLRDHLATVMGIPGSAFRSAIRPPLSPHRKGLKTRLICPETASEALEVLGPPETVKPVSAETWQLIREGDTEGRFSNNRSAMAQSIANSLRRASFSYSDFREILEDPTNLGGAKVQALIEEGKDHHEFLGRTWAKAESALDWQPEPVTDLLPRVQRAAEAAQWPGRSGPTQRSVMLAICQLGLLHGTTAPTFGLRGLQLAAQIGNRGTVSRALKALCERGWLQKLPRSNNPQHSDSYRILPQSEPHNPLGGRDIDGSVSVIQHPAFRQGSGLGRSVGWVWYRLHLANAPMTVRELIEATGYGGTTVGAALKRLDAYGLAKKSGKSWEVIGGWSDLDRIAETETTAASTYERQHNTVDTERKLFAARFTVSPDTLTNDLNREPF